MPPPQSAQGGARPKVPPAPSVASNRPIFVPSLRMDARLAEAQAMSQAKATSEAAVISSDEGEGEEQGGSSGQAMAES